MLFPNSCGNKAAAILHLTWNIITYFYCFYYFIVHKLSLLYQIYYDIVSFSIITLLHYHIYDCKLLLIYNCSLLHYYCIIIMSLLIIIIYYVIILSLHNWENYIKTEILLHNIQYNYVSIIASLLYDIVSSWLLQRGTIYSYLPFVHISDPRISRMEMFTWTSVRETVVQAAFVSHNLTDSDRVDSKSDRCSDLES